MKKTWWQRFKGSSAHTQANIVCTIVIAVATCAYAFIAFRQLGVINGQLTQMRNATLATENSAYAACMGAKIAHDTLVDIRNSGIDTHASALASVEQAAANIEAEKAIMTIVPRFPAPRDLYNHTLAIPYVIKSSGKSAILSGDYWIKAVLLKDNEALHFSSRNADHGNGKYLPAGAQFPESVDPRFHAPIASILVRDSSGHIVSDTTQEAADYMKGNGGIVYVYANLTYTDFFGTHKSKFCMPEFIVNVGQVHSLTNAERVCAAYNHQQYHVTQSPKLAPLPLEDSTLVDAIKCVAPTK